MKQVKNYLNILSMLFVLSLVIFTSCTGEKEEDLICKVSVISGIGGTATASENEVVSGWKVTLTAIPNNEYHFVNWTVNGVEVSKENPYTTTITQNTQFIANFEKDPYNGHEYVDLGLSVKWGTCNVGATVSEEYGNYFAWGETAPKCYYTSSTYKYGTWDIMIKYCINSSFGTVDNKTVLELSDDAARVNWGGSWRIPTYDELNELKNTNNCTWIWTTQNEVNGYKVISKINGNSIFLPAAGYRNYDYLGGEGSSGVYWSSSLGTNGVGAFYVLFGCDNVFWLEYVNKRMEGGSVRAVCE